MDKKAALIKKLEQIQKLANATRFQRFIQQPATYLSAILFRKLIYPFGKKGKIKSCQTFFDKSIRVLLPAGTDLFLLGAKSHISEIKLAKFICKNLKENAVFIDVGAHFGYYSLLASSLVGAKGKVISIEASQEIFKLLRENTAAEKNISIMHNACSNTSEKLNFYEYPILYSEYNTLSPNQFEEAEWQKKNPAKEIEVQAIKLEALFAEKSIEPSFIKIDVEGAEDKVLQGMQQSLEQGKNSIIAMEFLNDERHNKAHKIAAELLLANNYLPNVLDENGELLAIKLPKLKAYFEANKLDSDNIIFIKKGL